MTTPPEDQKLDDVLKTLKVEEPNTQTKADQIAHALTFMGQQEAANENTTSPSKIWQTVAGMCAIGLALYLGLAYVPLTSDNAEISHTLSQNMTIATLENPDIDQDMEMLQNMASLFEGQVAGIVINQGDIEVIPTEIDYAANATPVLIEIMTDEQHLQIISFNGQRMSLPLNGKSKDVEVLVSGSGEIILNGTDFFWSPDFQSEDAINYGVTAKIMERV